MLELIMKNKASFCAEKIKKIKKYDLGLSLFALMCFYVLYFDLVKSDPILKYDDELLLYPLKTISSVKEYFYFIKTGKITDLQPIRDLSLWFDIQLIRKFNYFGFHFTNLLIWIISLFNIKKLFQKFIKKDQITYLLLGLIIVSPVSVASVSWIAARKHLLSLMFILLAHNSFIYYFEKKSIRTLILTCVYFALALFSQPINSLFVVWAVTYSYFDFKEKGRIEKKTVWLNLILMQISATVLLLNRQYYSTSYLIMSKGVTKYLQLSIYERISRSILALGRYFYNSILPTSVGVTTYFEGSVENLIGLILIPFFGLIVYKNTNPKNAKAIILSLLHFIYPLIIVVVLATNIFGSNTYLINSMLGIYLIAGILASELSSKLISVIAIFSVLIFFNIKNSIQITGSLFNDHDMWAYSVEKEPTASGLASLARYKIIRNENKEAANLIERAEEMQDDYAFLGQLKAQNIFKNKKLDDIEKIKELKNLKIESSTKHLYLSYLYAQKKMKSEFIEEIKLIFAKKSLFNIEFLNEKGFVVAYAEYGLTYFLEDKTKNEILMLLGDQIFSDEDIKLFKMNRLYFKNKHDFEFNLPDF